MFATQETPPYDIAVVSVEEDPDGVPVPVPAEHFHEGNEQRVPFGQERTLKISVGLIKPTDQGPAPQVRLFSSSPLLESSWHLVASWLQCFGWSCS